MALVIVFPTAENENRQLEDLPLTDFDHVSERFSVGKDQVFRYTWYLTR